MITRRVACPDIANALVSRRCDVELRRRDTAKNAYIQHAIRHPRPRSPPKRRTLLVRPVWFQFWGIAATPSLNKKPIACARCMETVLYKTESIYSAVPRIAYAEA